MYKYYLLERVRVQQKKGDRAREVLRRLRGFPSDQQEQAGSKTHPVRIANQLFPEFPEFAISPINCIYVKLNVICCAFYDKVLKQ